MNDAPGPEQPALLGLEEVATKTTKRRRSAGPQPIADERPVARVVLDLQPSHLDREFDYLVPASMSDDVAPGVRVRARFGPQEVDGFVVARTDTTDHTGRLVPLRRVVSPDPVLAPEVLALARAVAQRYAGTLADVLRLTVPPRHARVEKEVLATLADAGTTGPPIPEPESTAPPSSNPAQPDPWSPYRGGDAFCRHVLAGQAPRAVWTPLPGLAPTSDGTPAHHPHWAVAIAHASRAALAGGRRALVVVPDARDADRVCAALGDAGITDHVRLLADDGPAPRYRAFLRARHGLASVVVGTRAAMFAPVPDLGLIALWGDGEDTLAEPHAPYPHAREVLALRSELEGAAYLLGSPGRTVQAQHLLATGWARELAAPRDVVRARAARVRALTTVELASEGPGAAARLPTAAWRAARGALEHGPVLVQVPRTGYLPVVACARCRAPARCTTCHGPLALPRTSSAPQCTWCGRLQGGWRCPECGAGQLRAVRVGSDRTAEELGRAFPGVTVRISASTASSGVLDRVDARPSLVVATPGAEPVADGGYAAALLLDAAVATSGTRLATATTALHRWLAAAHLVRPASSGGQVLLVGDAAPAPTGALVRFDPAGMAERELAERRELALPPTVRVAAVTGDRTAVDAVVGRVALAGPDTVLGPVDVPSSPADRRRTSATLEAPVRVLVRVTLAQGAELARQLHASLAVRSARREGGTVRVQLDPEEML